MAVRFADKAIDNWLAEKIQETNKEFEERRDPWDSARLAAFKEIRQQLHEFWGASLAPDKDLCGND